MTEQERLQTLIDDISILFNDTKQAYEEHEIDYEFMSGKLNAYRECRDMIQYHRNLLTGECE